MPLAFFTVIFLRTILTTVPPATHQHWSYILVGFCKGILGARQGQCSVAAQCRVVLQQEAMPEAIFAKAVHYTCLMLVNTRVSRADTRLHQMHAGNVLAASPL